MSSEKYQLVKSYTVCGVLEGYADGQVSTWRTVSVYLYKHTANGPEKRFEVITDGYQYQMQGSASFGEKCFVVESHDYFSTAIEAEVGYQHIVIRAFNYLVSAQGKAVD